jgi:alpha-tubulin suppressor-like RCC1 family protein
MTLTSSSRFLIATTLLVTLTSLAATRQPAQAQTTDSVAQIAAGDDHVCALLENATVHCWGRNDYGQSGDGSYIDRIKPGQVTGFPSGTRIAQIDANGYTSCALTSANQVYCWGNNSQGQLGVASTLTSSTSARLIAGLPANIQQISVGDQHACALGVQSTVYCWGKNNTGQLGRGTTGQATPTPDIATRFGILSQANAIERVAAGREHTCVLNAAGQVACVGLNTDYQIGSSSDISPQPDGSLVYQNSPGGMPTTLNGAEALTVKVDHNCVQIRATQTTMRPTLRCWARNSDGQTGVGAAQVRVAYPVELAAPPGAQGMSFTAAAASLGHTCALIDGKPYCWGSNAYSKLGGRLDPNATAVPSPVTVIPPQNNVAQTVLGFALGYNFTCARTTASSSSDTAPIRVYCWGQNDYSQIGKPKSVVETSGNLISFDVAQVPTTVTPTTVAATATATSAAQTPKRRYLPIAFAETGAEIEDNDTGESANALPLNKTLTARFDDAYDVYRTQLVTGTLTISVFNVAPTYASNVQLLLYRGIPGATNRVDLATLAPFTVSASGPGEYYIVVFSGSPQPAQAYRVLAR